MSVARLGLSRVWAELRLPRHPSRDQCCVNVFRKDSSTQRFRPSVSHAKGSHVSKPTDCSMTETFLGTTSEELRLWLQKHRVDTTCFGLGPTKSVEALFNEIRDGESVLESNRASDGHATRKVSVVTVRILNERGQELIEKQQVMPSGATRYRQQRLSEKLLPDESWVNAAKRGILEELGSVLPPDPIIWIDESTYVREEQRKESQSYPGLETLVSKMFVWPAIKSLIRPRTPLILC